MELRNHQGDMRLILDSLPQIGILSDQTAIHLAKRVSIPGPGCLQALVGVGLEIDRIGFSQKAFVLGSESI